MKPIAWVEMQEGDKGEERWKEEERRRGGEGRREGRKEGRREGREERGDEEGKGGERG